MLYFRVYQTCCFFILSQFSVTILASCQSPLTFMLQAGKILDIISSLGISGVNTSNSMQQNCQCRAVQRLDKDIMLQQRLQLVSFEQFFSIYDLVVCTHSVFVRCQTKQLQLWCYNTKTNLLLLLFCPRPVFSEVASFFRNADGNQLSLTARPASVTFDTDRSDQIFPFPLYRTTTECRTGLEYRLARSARPRETHQLHVYTTQTVAFYLWQVWVEPMLIRPSQDWDRKNPRGRTGLYLFRLLQLTLLCVLFCSTEQ